MAVVIGAVGLAGCVGGDDGQNLEVTDPSAVPVEFTEDTGAVRGAITDSELIPVEGAQVAILKIDPPIMATTNQAGAFALSNVPPGTHTLAVQKLGYTSIARSVNVVAGEEIVAEITMEILPVAEPWVESVSHAGQYGTGAAVVLTTACYGCANEERAWFFFGGYPEDFAGMVVEARWDTQDSLGFDLLARNGICGEDNDSSCIWYRTRGQSPLHYFVEPCADYGGAPTFGASPMPCGPEEFERNRGTSGGDAARLETWYVGLYEDEAHSADPVCTQLYSAGCYGVGLAPETRWETWVSLFHMELPPGGETYSAFPDA